MKKFTSNDLSLIGEEVVHFDIKRIMEGLEEEGLFTNSLLEQTIENVLNDLLSTDTIHNLSEEDLKELFIFVGNESFLHFMTNVIIKWIFSP